MSDKLTVVAKVVAKQEALDSVKKELVKMVEPTRQEDGCLEYRLHQDNDNPAVFIFYEIWESMEHLIAHTKSEHYLNYAAAVDGLIAEKVVHKMTSVRQA